MPAISSATAASRPAGIFMPTRDQLIQVYSSIARTALNSGKAHKLAHAPAHAEKYPSYPLSPNNLMGVKQTIYAIKGELYVKSVAVTRNEHATWYKVGPAPLF